ncbi:unnamed protein product [Protopolystoma xenopodis]|uniref:Uncharacterized protein n=1 Tax=Protopolystoma xenopodis TaxID=117903 RepID=A0A448X2W5_9PLAT|nr:unnamed protein product [Protopolystoma xenopodis]
MARVRLGLLNLSFNNSAKFECETIFQQTGGDKTESRKLYASGNREPLRRRNLSQKSITHRLPWQVRLDLIRSKASSTRLEKNYFKYRSALRNTTKRYVVGEPVHV